MKSRASLIPALIAIVVTATAAIGADAAPPTNAPEGLAGYPSTTKNPSAPCTCGDARGMSGWCERHGIGYVADVEIRSWLLYEMMDAHGHAIDIRLLDCPECQRAYQSDGFCEEHKMGFVGKKAYFSRLTFELARADPIDPTTIACPVCRKNTHGHGWCEAHQIGMVNHLAIRDRAHYRHLLAAIENLEIANKASEQCEECALAIVADGRCPFHRITYKDGHAVPAP